MPFGPAAEQEGLRPAADFARQPQHRGDPASGHILICTRLLLMQYAPSIVANVIHTRSLLMQYARAGALRHRAPHRVELRHTVLARVLRRPAVPPAGACMNAYALAALSQHSRSTLAALAQLSVPQNFSPS